MKITRVLMVAVLVPLCMGAFYQKTKYIWRKNEVNYVKLAKAGKEAGELRHPAEFTPEQMTYILTSIKYSRSWINLPGEAGKKTAKQYEVFLPEEAEQLGAHFSKAFKEANSTQWVDFSLQEIRARFGFVGNERLTDGVAFVKYGQLNIVFRNLGEAVGADQPPVTTDPFRYYAGSSSLVPGPGQEPGKNKKGKVLKNYIVIDLETALKPPRVVAPDVPPGQPEFQPGTTVEQKPAERSAKDRLTELRELYDKSLITEEEYNRKKKEILDEL